MHISLRRMGLSVWRECDKAPPHQMRHSTRRARDFLSVLNCRENSNGRWGGDSPAICIPQGETLQPMERRLRRYSERKGDQGSVKVQRGLRFSWTSRLPDEVIMWTISSKGFSSQKLVQTICRAVTKSVFIHPNLLLDQKKN